MKTTKQQYYKKRHMYKWVSFSIIKIMLQKDIKINIMLRKKMKSKGYYIDANAISVLRHLSQFIYYNNNNNNQYRVIIYPLYVNILPTYKFDTLILLLCNNVGILSITWYDTKHLVKPFLMQSYFMKSMNFSSFRQCHISTTLGDWSERIPCMVIDLKTLQKCYAWYHLRID